MRDQATQRLACVARPFALPFVSADLPENRLEIPRDEQANHRFERVFVGFYFARMDERQGGSKVPGGAQFLDFGKIVGKHGNRRGRQSCGSSGRSWPSKKEDEVFSGKDQPIPKRKHAP